MTIKNFVNFILIVLGTISLIFAANLYNSGNYIGNYNFASLSLTILVGLGLMITGFLLWE